jgi:hypothetical protein
MCRPFLRLLIEGGMGQMSRFFILSETMWQLSLLFVIVGRAVTVTVCTHSCERQKAGMSEVVWYWLNKHDRVLQSVPETKQLLSMRHATQAVFEWELSSISCTCSHPQEKFS